MRVPLLVLLLGCSPLLAGCVEQPADGDPALPDIGDPVGGLAQNATLRLEGCRDNFFPTQVPREWAEPFVAEGFRLRHPVVTLAHVSFKYCERISNDTMVEEGVHLLETTLDAMADFEGAYEGPVVLYVEMMTDSQIIQETWHSFNMTAVNASFACETNLVLTEEVSECAATSQTGSFAFGFADTGFKQARVRESFEYWLPGPPHVQVGVSENASIGFLTDMQVVPFELSGRSASRTLLGEQERWTGHRFPNWDVDVTYELNGFFYP